MTFWICSRCEKLVESGLHYCAKNCYTGADRRTMENWKAAGRPRPATEPPKSPQS